MSEGKKDPHAQRRGTCPHCQREFTYDPADEPKWLPFCCDRCQWADLGRWLEGEFRISREVTERDIEQQD